MSDASSPTGSGRPVGWGENRGQLGGVRFKWLFSCACQCRVKLKVAAGGAERCDADGLLVVVCVMYLSCMCVSESLASLGHSIRLLSIDRESNRQKKFRRSRRGGEPRPRELDRRRGGEERPRESDRRRRPASPPFSPPFGGGLASSSSSW